METEVVVLSDGTQVEVRPPTGVDLINARANDEFVRTLKLIASCVVRVNGEEKELHYLNDVGKWKLGDIMRVSKVLMKLMELEEEDLKNF